MEWAFFAAIGIILILLGQSIVGVLFIAFGLAQAVSNVKPEPHQEHVPVESVEIYVDRSGPDMPGTVTLVTESPMPGLKGNIIKYGFQPIYKTIKWFKKKVSI